VGLSLQVGLLADLAEGRPDNVDALAGDFDALNRALAAAGAPTYVEPRQLARPLRWSADMFGYSGLHYLRRVAAHLDLRGTLPAPGDENAANDPVLLEYYEAAGVARPGLLRRIFGTRRWQRPRTFDHLILHSDAEGFYAPVDFPHVIFSSGANKLVGDMLGSAVRLREECTRLATALGVPPGLDSEDDQLWSAARAQGTGEGWQRYGIEAFSCVRLLEGASCALAARAALAFT
jgi:hypothetical protein